MNHLKENGYIIGYRLVTGSMASSWDEFLFLKKIKKNNFELSIRKYEIVDVDDCEALEIVTSDTKDKYGEYEIKVPEYYNGRKLSKFFMNIFRPKIISTPINLVQDQNNFLKKFFKKKNLIFA